MEVKKFINKTFIKEYLLKNQDKIKNQKDDNNKKLDSQTSIYDFLNKDEGD